MHRNQPIKGTNGFRWTGMHKSKYYIPCRTDSMGFRFGLVKHTQNSQTTTHACTPQHKQGFMSLWQQNDFIKSGTGRETESEWASEHEGLLVSLYSKQYLPVANGRVICASLTLITQRLLTQAPSRRNNRCRHNGTLNVAAVWSTTINPACLCVPLRL